MSETDMKICRLVEGVLDGRVDRSAFWAASEKLEDASPAASRAWHLASHFFEDEDIRAREPEYARDQIEQMKRLVAVLRIEPQRAAE